MSARPSEPNESKPAEVASTFVDLMQRLQNGDETAARVIHERYTRGLVNLARRNLTESVRHRVDPESVVQSVYASFFYRQRDQEFPKLGDWDDLWGLLTILTLRKCANRRRFHHQARRDVQREMRQDTSSAADTPWEPTGAEPTPEQGAVLHETLEQILGALDDRQRTIIELLLQGHTIDEVRQCVGCGERTVRRVRDRIRNKIRAMWSESGM